MKKTLLLALLFIALGGVTWYAVNQKKKTANSSVQSWDMDFAVQNVEAVGKIFIADRSGKTAKLTLGKDGVWMYNDSWEARQTAVKTLLETIKRVQVQVIPPKASEEHIIKSLAAEGLKVEIYDKNDQKIKCYYVGGVTFDERGTYMIMEGSEQPYIVHLPHFTGQIRVRYLLGDDEWRSRSVFAARPEDIQSISIEYPQKKNQSFRLEKTGNAQYEVKPFFSTTPAMPTPPRKGVSEAYLLNFESLMAEAYETGFTKKDSVMSLVPFAIVTLKKTNGTTRKATFWPHEYEVTTLGGIPKQQINRYFTAIDDTSAFMLTQQRVMGKMFRGYDYFFEGQAGMKN